MSNLPPATGLRSPDDLSHVRDARVFPGSAARRLALVNPPRKAPTYTELQDELGSENLGRLIGNIGERLKSYGLEQAGIPIAYAIDRVLQTLTPSERLSMAQSNTVPPSVEALIGAEAQSAKAQQQQLEAAHKEGRSFPLIPLGMLAAFGYGPLAATAKLPSNDSSAANSSTRFEELQARALASKLGMGWAAENPDLMKLGPAAVQALADVHLKHESYQRLTQEAGFKAKDVVTLAQYAKEKKIDANRAADDIADANKDLSPEEKRRHNDALLGFMGAKTPQQAATARARLLEVQKGISDAHPEKPERFNNLNRTLKVKTEQDATEKARADQKEIKAEQKEVKANTAATTKKQTAAKALAALN